MLAWWDRTHKDLRTTEAQWKRRQYCLIEIIRTQKTQKKIRDNSKQTQSAIIAATFMSSAERIAGTSTRTCFWKLIGIIWCIVVFGFTGLNRKLGVFMLIVSIRRNACKTRYLAHAIIVVERGKDKMGYIRSFCIIFYSCATEVNSWSDVAAVISATTSDLWTGK